MKSLELLRRQRSYQTETLKAFSQRITLLANQVDRTREKLSVDRGADMVLNKDERKGPSEEGEVKASGGLILDLFDIEEDQISILNRMEHEFDYLANSLGKLESVLFENEDLEGSSKVVGKY